MHHFDPHALTSIIITNDVHHQYEVLQDAIFVIPEGTCGQLTYFIDQPSVGSIKIYCASFVQATIRCIIMTGQAVDCTISIIMCGTQSNVMIVGLAAVSGQGSVQVTTHQIHCGAHNRSELVMQGLVADRANLKFEGTIRIEKDAAGTLALQNNKNILLSDTARAISIPNIEVLHHDVQCYHGAAVSKFDVTHQQYMASRGMQFAQAQRLLLQAFVAPVITGYEKEEQILQKLYMTMITQDR